MIRGIYTRAATYEQKKLIDAMCIRCKKEALYTAVYVQG